MAFESAQLQDADLRQVNLRGTWLQQAIRRCQVSSLASFRIFMKATRYLYCCAHSPHGNSLAVSPDNGIIKLYLTSTRELTQTLTGHDGII